MKECLYCGLEHGARINFLRGGICKKCGSRNPVPIAVYTHDSVGDDEIYYHHFRFEKRVTCPSCGRSAMTTERPCGNLNAQLHIEAKESGKE